MRRGLRLLGPSVAALLSGAAAAWAACPPAPEPVTSLSFGSRYAEDSESRSEIDPDSAAEADEALQPVDDFLRDLVKEANAVVEGSPDSAAMADCIIAAIADWARADALSDLGSRTANLVIGSRLAGFALVLMQVEPHATHPEDLNEIKAWLSRRIAEQMRFWDDEAPPGARSGNLRAWAALAASAASTGIDDPILRAWAVWSVGHVLCTAGEDGHLPQEMTRGRLALHYQLHATAPLVVATLLLERQGLPLAETCDGAIHRIVGFALDDLATGERTEAITGEVQSYFDGSDQLEGFHLAWLEAYLHLPSIPRRDEAEALADSYRPLNYSKLGGNQSLLWDDPP